MFDHFWDFNRLVEDGAPGKVDIMGSHHLLQKFWVLGLYNRYGIFTHGYYPCLGILNYK
jgi:hypothetical protein